jgi:hypothetical protein
MPLILDVLTSIDERSAAASARQLEHQFTASGEAAGSRFRRQHGERYYVGFCPRRLRFDAGRLVQWRVGRPGAHPR